MQLFNVGNTSIASDGTVKPVEIYLPLWFADGTGIGTTNTSPGALFLGDGGAIGNSSLAATKLHTLSANWPSGTKFAVEANIVSSSGATASAQLYDFTGSALVSGSTVSTTAFTTVITLRSAQFTLTPGRQYGIALWSNTGTVSIADASLIAFP